MVKDFWGSIASFGLFQKLLWKIIVSLETSDLANNLVCGHELINTLTTTRLPSRRGGSYSLRCRIIFAYLNIGTIRKECGGVLWLVKKVGIIQRCMENRG